MSITASDLPTFSNFGHIESTVSAIQLSPETQYDVLMLLGAESEQHKLITLHMEFDTSQNCIIFTYRYLEDTVDSKLELGDYLVRLNAGNYVVMSEEEFNSQYIPVYKDQDLIPPSPLTVAEATLQFLHTKYPDDFSTIDDITTEKLVPVVEAFRPWYNKETNNFDIKFTDCALIDPAGLNNVIKVFPEATFIQNDSTFSLNFSNGNYGNPKQQQNLFNYTALQTLIKELQKLDSNFAKRITSFNFMSADAGITHNAIAPSVTDDQWESIVTLLMSVTGVKKRLNIRR